MEADPDWHVATRLWQSRMADYDLKDAALFGAIVADFVLKTIVEEQHFSLAP